jgi:hypothetical protein
MMCGRMMCRNGSNGGITRLNSKLAMSHMYYGLCRFDSLCRHFIVVESVNIMLCIRERRNGDNDSAGPQTDLRGLKNATMTRRAEGCRWLKVMGSSVATDKHVLAYWSSDG